VALARQIALGYISRHPPEKAAWDWGEGVLMLSLVELYRVTGDTRLRAHYKAWLDAHIQQGYEIKWSDSCPPALAALALASEPGADPAYRKVVDDVVAYYRAAPRTAEGGISHMGNVVPLVKTLWLDSLFMVGVVVARQAQRAGDQPLLDSVGQQFQIFARRLQGADGLLTHAGNWPGQQPGIYWGRGNGWVTAAGHEVLRLQRLRGLVDGQTGAVLDRQVRALLPLQDSSTGLWWTVLNRPGETYLETSASALFAYGLARGYRYGQRGDDVLPVIRRALQGIRGAIKTDAGGGGPVVTGISGPTMAGSFSYYAGIARQDDLHFGVGAVILALLESSGLP
jgi:unsaturated rhamnogalacturonyl hydrolase